jgi:argininosuccinate lyase
LLDERLVRFDILASKAHAEMLCHCGYLNPRDCDLLLSALCDLAESHRRGEWHISLEEEDCHTAIESRLTEKLGEPGKAIHLGRSRNDQVLVAIRLYLKDALDVLSQRAQRVAEALDDMVQRYGHFPIPGYTHMQRAMPSTIALWAGAFSSEILDDVEGLRLARRRADKNPLGSAAGYGVPLLPLNRQFTTDRLGFSTTHEPVTAVQLSRGKAEAGALFEASLLAQDLGRLASDLCLFNTSEFGMVLLPAALTTGSSMLPQKRNPDLFELARGRSGEATAALLEVLSITAKMTSGYHRDLQLLKNRYFVAWIRSMIRLLCWNMPSSSSVGTNNDWNRQPVILPFA